MAQSKRSTHQEKNHRKHFPDPLSLPSSTNRLEGQPSPVLAASARRSLPGARIDSSTSTCVTSQRESTKVFEWNDYMSSIEYLYKNRKLIFWISELEFSRTDHREKHPIFCCTCFPSSWKSFPPLVSQLGSEGGSYSASHPSTNREAEFFPIISSIMLLSST